MPEAVTTQKLRYLSLSAWEEQYKPCTKDGSYLINDVKDFVAPPGTTPDCIWTLMTDDTGNEVIASGQHFVNREAYILTERPVEAAYSDVLVPYDHELTDRLFEVTGTDDEFDPIRAETVEKAQAALLERYPNVNVASLAFEQIGQSMADDIASGLAVA